MDPVFWILLTLGVLMTVIAMTVGLLPIFLERLRLELAIQAALGVGALPREVRDALVAIILALEN